MIDTNTKENTLNINRTPTPNYLPSPPPIADLPDFDADFARTFENYKEALAALHQAQRAMNRSGDTAGARSRMAERVRAGESDIAVLSAELAAELADEADGRHARTARLEAATLVHDRAADAVRSAWRAVHPKVLAHCNKLEAEALETLRPFKNNKTAEAQLAIATVKTNMKTEWLPLAIASYWPYSAPALSVPSRVHLRLAVLEGREPLMAGRQPERLPASDGSAERFVHNELARQDKIYREAIGESPPPAPPATDRANRRIRFGQ